MHERSVGVSVASGHVSSGTSQISERAGGSVAMSVASGHVSCVTSQIRATANLQSVWKVNDLPLCEFALLLYLSVILLTTYERPIYTDILKWDGVSFVPHH